MGSVNPELFKLLLPQAVCQETSFDPDSWNEINPLFGQCVVAALLYQDYFDSELVRGEIASPELSMVHYWNRLPSGEEIDVTTDQFGANRPQFSDVQTRDRQSVLDKGTVLIRYLLLKDRFEALLDRMLQ